MKKLAIILALLSIGCSKQQTDCNCGVISNKKIHYTTMQIPGGSPIQIKTGWEYTVRYDGCPSITYQVSEQDFQYLSIGQTKCK